MKIPLLKVSILAQILFLFTLIPQSGHSQSGAMQMHANEFGKRLYKRCSAWGGKDLYTEVKNHYYLSASDALVIEMQVNWKGKLSSFHYYIHGKLYIYEDGRADWKKIKDSGGFVPACSTVNYSAIWTVAEKVLLFRRYRPRASR